MARYSPIMEPLTFVEDYTEHPKTDGGRLRLGFLRERIAESRARARRRQDLKDGADPGDKARLEAGL